MKRNYFHLGLSVFFSLIVLAACTGSKPPVPIVPTTDLKKYETSVAGTKQAVAQLTEQAATPTLISATSTPKVSQITKTSLVSLDDQSTLFIDQKVGFQLTIPAGWLAVRINEDEYYKAFALDEVLASPAISDRLTKIQINNADYFRLDAIDIRPEHVVNGMITDITIFLQQESSTSLEEWATFERNRVSIFEGYRSISSGFQQTDNNMRVLVVERSWNWINGGTVYFRRVYFDLPSGTLTLDFQSYLDFKDTVLPDFEQVVNSLTLLNP